MVVSSVLLSSDSPSLSPAACRNLYRRPLTGARVIFRGRKEPGARCWSWRCKGCAFLKSKDATRLVALGVDAALAEGLPLILLTVTEPSHARAFRESSAALTQLIKRLQARHGGQLRWIAVAEWQQRGAVHWHLVIAGLVYRHSWPSPKGRVFPGHAPSQSGSLVRKEADLRPLVERYGFGAVFNVHAVGVRPEDTAQEVAGYLSKYLTKTDDMTRLPKRAQPVRSSRGRNQWAPGYTLTGLRDERRDAARESAAGTGAA